MQQEQESQFDDPILKEALKRSLGREAAPVGLRERVAAIAAEERAAEARATVRRWRPLAGLAAAAVLLIGFGLAYSIMFREPPAPQWFAAAMVRTHDEHATLPDHQLLPDGPVNDPSTLSSKLRDRLGYPVLAASLGDGWTFKGAGVCQLNGVEASHLLFTRGDQTVSIFSVSSKILYSGAAGADGTSYSQVEQGHPVSGFVHGGAVHCLVGSSAKGDLDLKTVTRLRDQLRKDFTRGTATAPN